MSEEENGNDERRVGRNLKGLLKFCTEVTAKEDNTKDSEYEQMDEERKEFLRKVMSDIHDGPVKKFAICLERLANDSVLDANEDYSDAEEALDALEDYVEDINYANDLYKMGGFPVLIRCLDSPHTHIRAKVSSRIGQTCQNDYNFQKSMTELDALPKLLHILDEDGENVCRINALFAISCIVRECKEAEEEFLRLGGLSSLMRAMQGGIEKVEMKAIFLINSIAEKEEFKSELVTIGFVEMLACLLVDDSKELDNNFKEQCTRGLSILVKDCKEAQKKCLEISDEFVKHIRKRREVLQNFDDTYKEEEEYLSSLLENLEMQSDSSDSSGKINNCLMLR